MPSIKIDIYIPALYAITNISLFFHQMNILLFTILISICTTLYYINIFLFDLYTNFSIIKSLSNLFKKEKKIVYNMTLT